MKPIPSIIGPHCSSHSQRPPRPSCARPVVIYIVGAGHPQARLTRGLFCPFPASAVPSIICDIQSGIVGLADVGAKCFGWRPRQRDPQRLSVASVLVSLLPPSRRVVLWSRGPGTTRGCLVLRASSSLIARIGANARHKQRQNQEPVLTLCISSSRNTCRARARPSRHHLMA